jgi:hypothetical protein
MLTDESRYEALRSIQSGIRQKMNDHVEQVHDWRMKSGSSVIRSETGFTLKLWELIHQQFMHFGSRPTQCLHIGPSCPVFARGMVWHDLLEFKLKSREEPTLKEMQDLRMYGVRCYEMRMVRQMVREAFMSKNDANYMDKLRLFVRELWIWEAWKSSLL